MERLWRKAQVDTTTGTKVDFTYRNKESLQEDAAPPGFHHPKCPLHHTSGPGVMPVVPGLHRILHRLPVRGYEGDGCLKTGITPIPKDDPARRRVELAEIQGAPPQHPCIMDCTRWLYPYVRPVDAANNTAEGTGASKVGKAFPNALQLICSRKMDHPGKDGHDAVCNPMYNIMDCGGGDIEGLRYEVALASQYRKTPTSRASPHPWSLPHFRASTKAFTVRLDRRKSRLKSPSPKKRRTTGAWAFHFK